MARPMLGDIELQQVQDIEIDEDQVLEQHGVPALEGDFLQGLGRRALQVTLTGVLTGPEVGEGLKNLRDKFRAAEPVSFVADITTATRVDQVLIQEMGVHELAGKPERFEYAFSLREHIAPPPAPEREAEAIETEIARDARIQVDGTTEDTVENVGELRVQVELAEGENDFTDIAVLVEGVAEAGERVNLVLEEQTAGVYSRENVPAGNYTVRAFRRA